MRRNVQKMIISMAIVGFVGVGSAAAGGGMGDVNAHVKELNAICDAQRRGEVPATPSLCLPEIPPGPVYRDHSERR